MRIFLIILIFFIQNFAHSKELKWERVDQTEHENYYEIIGKATNEIVVNGEKKKFKFTIRQFFPKNTKTNKKEGLCKKWRIEELTYGGKYIWKKYALNDCMPCIDKGSGYICSYPHFLIEYRSELYGKYWNPDEDYLSDLEDLMDDGTKFISMTVNLGSREQIELFEKKANFFDQGHISFFRSRIIKYNTKLRKILSESSEPKKIKEFKFRMVFDRIKNNAHELINTKGELKIREKDLRILFSTEPSATVIKYQTRN